MVELLGGAQNTQNAGRDEFADWLMVQSHGKTYLGNPVAGQPRLNDPPDIASGPPFTSRANAIAQLAAEGRRLDGFVLDPIFEYVTLMASTPQGPMPVFSVRPCFGLVSIRRLAILEYGAACRIGDLLPDEQRQIGGQIETVLRAIAEVRAEAAGVKVAPASALSALDVISKGGRR